MNSKRHLYYPRKLEFGNMPNYAMNLLDLPYLKGDVSEAFSYKTDTDLAVVVPIFGRNTNSVKHHLYAKKSVYTALSLLKWTDIKESKVPFYFLIGDICRSDIEGYLDTAGIPAKNRVVYNQSMRADCLYKLEGLSTPELADIERFLIVDADVWVHCYEGSRFDVFKSIFKSWNTELLLYPRSGSVIFDGYLGENPPEYIVSDFLQKVSDLLNADVGRDLFDSDSNTFIKVNGAIHGVSRELFDNIEFKEFISISKNFLYSDEVMFSMWLYNHPVFNLLPFDFIEGYPSEDEVTIVHKPPTCLNQRTNDETQFYENWKFKYLAKMQELASEYVS